VADKLEAAEKRGRRSDPTRLKGTIGGHRRMQCCRSAARLITKVHLKNESEGFPKRGEYDFTVANERGFACG